MRSKELNRIDDLIEEAWGDWECVFDIMKENNLKIVGCELRTYDDSCIFDLLEWDDFTETTANLFALAYEYYKKNHSSSNTNIGRSKYMKLC